VPVVVPMVVPMAVAVPSPVCRRKDSVSLSRLLLLVALFLLSDTVSWRGSMGSGVDFGPGILIVHAFVPERRITNVNTNAPTIQILQHKRQNNLVPAPTITTTQTPRSSSSTTFSVSSWSKLFLAPEISPLATTGLANYAPAATTLFNNMKLPAAVVTAGMISLGFATTFPELPKKRPTTNMPYPDDLRARCESLKRLHIVVSLIAVTSELIVVLWAAVEVNQLTEKQYELATSVWDLLGRDCDLAWSAVNSHFILGIMGFVTMLALRAYVMLIAAEASTALMTAASTGTGAALCLLISIVNRGVESGGGGIDRYGNTILDLFGHYAVLLSKASTNSVSPGPLQFMAIVLELTSLFFMANVLIFQNGKMKYDTQEDKDDDEGDKIFGIAEECPLIDIVEIAPSSSLPPSSMTKKIPTNNQVANNQVRVVVGGGSQGANPNCSSGEPFFATTTNKDTSRRAKVARCLAMEEDEKQAQAKLEEDEDLGYEDSSVSVF